MKTREQAEKRAMELYEGSKDALTDHIRLFERQAFLQCWDEMQKDKQRNQRISEKSEEEVNKYVHKQLLCEMMRKDEESGVYEPKEEKEYSDEEIKEMIKRINEQPLQIMDTGCTQLREAAERVVWKWNNKCAITAEDIQQIEKELK